MRAWLGRRAELDGVVPGGARNFTWYVRVGVAAAVLQHAPAGKLLPTAHDLSRENRFLSALSGSPVPVPEVIAFCEDPAVAGRPFLLMDRIAGDCLVRDPIGDRDPDRLARSAVDYSTRAASRQASSTWSRSRGVWRTHRKPW